MALDSFTDDEVKAAIESLPDNFRIAVLLADVEGFSYKEIAEITDVPIGTVMSRIHRGRRALQKALHEFAEARGLVGSSPRPGGVTGGRSWQRGQQAAQVTAGGQTAEGVDCDEAVHELYHYLDGELTDERRQEIAVHLDLCGPCADAAGFESELRMVIASRCRDRVPDSLIARVAEAIDEAQRRTAPPTGPAQ